MQIVELKDAGNSAILLSKGYKEIYQEIRSVFSADLVNCTFIALQCHLLL